MNNLLQLFVLSDEKSVSLYSLMSFLILVHRFSLIFEIDFTINLTAYGVFKKKKISDPYIGLHGQLLSKIDYTIWLLYLLQNLQSWSNNVMTQYIIIV